MKSVSSFSSLEVKMYNKIKRTMKMLRAVPLKHMRDRGKALLFFHLWVGVKTPTNLMKYIEKLFNNFYGLSPC